MRRKILMNEGKILRFAQNDNDKEHPSRHYIIKNPLNVKYWFAVAVWWVRNIFCIHRNKDCKVI